MSMAEYCISCCSTADLTKEYFDKRGIHYVCFHYELALSSEASFINSLS